MISVRVAWRLSFFNIIYCRTGDRFLEKTHEQHLSAVAGGFKNGSQIGLTTGDGAKDFKASCSSSGPSWDPLLSCFDGPVQDVIRYHLLCKLKKNHDQEVQEAWSGSASFKANVAHNRSRSIGHSALEQVEASDYEARNHMNARYSEQKELHEEKMFRTCAVVSNSGVLREHEHGDAIDNADLVLRFNDAPLRGWDKLVGKKESMRVVSGQFPKRVLDNEVATYDLRDDVLYGLISGGKIANLDSLRARHPMTTFQVLSPGLMTSFRNTLQSIYDSDKFHNNAISFNPTTGAIGMLSALSRCDEILAYGMAATPAAGNSPYHYFREDEPYSENKADYNFWHKTFAAEKDLWRRVARNAPHEIDASDVAVIQGFSQIRCE